MADITITATNVVAGASAQVVQGYLGATVTAGQVVYQDPTDQSFKLADANSATAAARVPFGIALNGGATGQAVTVQRSGEITIGGTVTVGGLYVLSATAGGIAPAADLASGLYTSLVGIGKTSSILTVHIFSGGVAVP